MKSNNIAIFSTTDSLGGAEQVLYKIAKFYSEQEANAIKIIFFKPKTTQYWQENLNRDVEIIYINNKFGKLISYLKKNKFEIVFSSHLMLNALLGILRNLKILKTKRLVGRESTTIFGRYSGVKLLQYRLAYWLGYRKLDLVITQTDTMRAQLLKALPYLKKRTKVETIKNPFTYPEKKETQETIDITGEFIVSAGRLIPEKGFTILISAFKKLSDDYPTLKLVILGEGILRQKLETQIKALKLEETVILKGHANNVYPYFRRAKLCVVSSIREGFPNVLLQMMSQNQKVASTKCAGDIDQISGLYLAEINNVESLYSAIKGGLTSNDSHKKQLFDTELDSHSIKAFIKKITNFIE
ncbi:glycosyltransferase [Niabella hirudinis]|uniref:glycosyltransferase n=1 Tax=Niabella hirudinis TaxID=1285929 RepID=UPI003EBC6ECB